MKDKKKVIERLFKILDLNSLEKEKAEILKLYNDDRWADGEYDDLVELYALMKIKQEKSKD